MQGWLKCEKRVLNFGCTMSNKKNYLAGRGRRSVDVGTYIIKVGYKSMGSTV
jgi:hypothetical protein